MPPVLFTPVAESALYEEYRGYLSNEKGFDLHHLNGNPSTGSGRVGSVPGIQPKKVPYRQDFESRYEHCVSFWSQEVTNSVAVLSLRQVSGLDHCFGKVTSHSGSVSPLIFDVVHHSLLGEPICSLHQE